MFKLRGKHYLVWIRPTQSDIHLSMRSFWFLNKEKMHYFEQTHPYWCFNFGIFQIDNVFLLSYHIKENVWWSRQTVVYRYRQLCPRVIYKKLVKWLEFDIPYSRHIKLPLFRWSSVTSILIKKFCWNIFFKSEVSSSNIIAFIAIRAKVYSLISESSENGVSCLDILNKLKGVNKSSVEMLGELWYFCMCI